MKCPKCKKVKLETDERFHFFELVWKCDLILSQGIWQGILCEECHKAFIQKIESTVLAFKEEP